MRSYDGDPPMYAANGYCTIIAQACEGDAEICDMTVVGDYDGMTACPECSVMVDASKYVEVTVLWFTYSATISVKNCSRPCETDEDCRLGEYDDVWGEDADYQCIDKDGVKFCSDPRNFDDLVGDYTATQF